MGFDLRKNRSKSSANGFSLVQQDSSSRNSNRKDASCGDGDDRKGLKNQNQKKLSNFRNFLEVLLFL